MPGDSPQLDLDAFVLSISQKALVHGVGATYKNQFWDPRVPVHYKLFAKALRVYLNMYVQHYINRPALSIPTSVCCLPVTSSPPKSIFSFAPYIKLAGKELS